MDSIFKELPASIPPLCGTVHFAQFARERQFSKNGNRSASIARHAEAKAYVETIAEYTALGTFWSAADLTDSKEAATYVNALAIELALSIS